MKAFEVINSSKSWIKSALSVDKDGNYAPPRSHNAVRFCAMGALERAYPNESQRWRAYMLVVDAISKRTKGKYNVITLWNNSKHRRWWHVHNLFKKLDV